MTRVERIGGAELYLGDALEVLATLDADSVDAVVTDPPYELNFMNRRWDNTGVAFRPETWAAVAGVMKPGAHLVAFGGTRTYHRLACAIEDAGFEVRDAIMWHYGQGFPKSHDVSKGIDRAAGAEREVVGSKLGRPGMARNGSNQSFDNLRRMEGREDRPNPAIDITAPATDAARQWAGWGTALKPSTEIICLARKPLSEPTVAANVLRWGTGALNIDGCRVECEPIRTVQGQSTRQQAGEMYSARDQREKAEFNSHPAGRWPANVAHDGSPEVLEAFKKFGQLTSGSKIGGQYKRGDGIFRRDDKGMFDPGRADGEACYADTGTAARFFYAAKADAADRLGSKHPTVKPVALMRWLVRLVTPPGGTVLDCFAGTGTTLQAALLEGFSAIGIEREAEYFEDCKRRLGHMSGADAPLFADAAA